MRSPRFATLLSAFALALIPATSEAALTVTLDSGLGTQVFTDVDNDGSVDFDVTVDGIFRAQGTAHESIEPLRGRIALKPLLLNPVALFRNLSASPQTFTVTVQSSAFPVSIVPWVGWDIFYYATAGDLVDMSVDTPVHSVTARVNNGVDVLGSATGSPLTSNNQSFGEENHGAGVPAAGDVSFQWSISLGANDEIRVANDNDFDGDSIQVNVFDQTQKCIDKMNNGARKVGDAAQKSDVKCLKETGPDVTACIDLINDEKTEKKESKLDADYAALCDPVPAYGVNSRTCCEGGTDEGLVCTDNADCNNGGVCTPGACIGAAADAGAGLLTHDLHGATVLVSADKKTAKCQEAVAKTLGKLYTTRWKDFRSCKKDGFAVISGDLLLKALCLQPQPDPKQKIAKAITKLGDAVQKKCLDQGVTGLATVFPGECSTEVDGAYAACLSTAAACRFCVAVNDADAIVPLTDCDNFDDGVANASCSYLP